MREATVCRPVAQIQDVQISRPDESQLLPSACRGEVQVQFLTPPLSSRLGHCWNSWRTKGNVSPTFFIVIPTYSVPRTVLTHWRRRTRLALLRLVSPHTSGKLRAAPKAKLIDYQKKKTARSRFHSFSVVV